MKRKRILLGITSFENDKEPDIFYRVKEGREIFDKWHNHKYWEIMIVQKGEVLHRTETEERFIHENEICIVYPDTVHQVKEKTDQDIRFVNLEISCAFFEGLADRFNMPLTETVKERQYLVFSVGSGEINELMGYISQAQRYPYYYADECQLYLKVMVGHIILKSIMHLRDREIRYSNNDVVNSVFNAFNKAENVHLALHDICSQINYSEAYVIRLFKKMGLQSPNFYFSEVKLNRACALLGTTNISVMEISNLIGYQSLSHFNTLFKRKYNMSPYKYRMLYRR